MTRIAISEAALAEIARTMPLGSVGYENAVNEKGERYIFSAQRGRPPDCAARPRGELQRCDPAGSEGVRTWQERTSCHCLRELQPRRGIGPRGRAPALLPIPLNKRDCADRVPRVGGEFANDVRPAIKKLDSVLHAP